MSITPTKRRIVAGVTALLLGASGLLATALPAAADDPPPDVINYRISNVQGATKKYQITYGEGTNTTRYDIYEADPEADAIALSTTCEFMPQLDEQNKPKGNTGRYFFKVYQYPRYNKEVATWHRVDIDYGVVQPDIDATTKKVSYDESFVMPPAGIWRVEAYCGLGTIDGWDPGAGIHRHYDLLLYVPEDQLTINDGLPWHTDDAVPVESLSYLNYYGENFDILGHVAEDAAAPKPGDVTLEVKEPGGAWQSLGAGSYASSDTGKLSVAGLKLPSDKDGDYQVRAIQNWGPVQDLEGNEVMLPITLSTAYSQIKPEEPAPNPDSKPADPKPADPKAGKKGGLPTTGTSSPLMPLAFFAGIAGIAALRRKH